MFWEAQPRFNRSEPGGYFRGSLWNLAFYDWFIYQSIRNLILNRTTVEQAPTGWYFLRLGGFFV